MSKPSLRALEAIAGRWGVDVQALLTGPDGGPEAALRALVEEYGATAVAAASHRVCGDIAL